MLWGLKINQIKYLKPKVLYPANKKKKSFQYENRLKAPSDIQEFRKHSVYNLSLNDGLIMAPDQKKGVTNSRHEWNDTFTYWQQKFTGKHRMKMELSKLYKYNKE